MRSTRASGAPLPGASRISTSWGRMKRPDSSLTGPDEPHDELGGGRLVDLARGRADLLHPAVVQHDDLVGHLERLALVVGHEHRRDVDLVVQLARPVAELGADLRVQGAEGLVEQQHLRPRRKRPGQRDALALTAESCDGYGSP